MQMNQGGGQNLPKVQQTSQKDIFQQFYTNYKKSYDYKYYQQFDKNDPNAAKQEDDILKLYGLWNEMQNEYLKTNPQVKNEDMNQKNRPKMNDKNQKPQIKQQLPNQTQVPPQQKKPQDQQAQQQIVKEKLEEIQKANPVTNTVYQQPVQNEQEKIGQQQQQYQQYYQYQQYPQQMGQMMYAAAPMQQTYQQPYIPQQQQMQYPQQIPAQTYIPQYRQDIYPAVNPMLIPNQHPQNYATGGKLDISNYITSSLQK